MKLEEKLKTINEPKINSLITKDYSSIEEFWDEVIVPNLPDFKTIRAYHKLLTDYINSDNPTFAMRAHYQESHGHINLRRGWLNRMTDDIGKIEFFYTDNFFVHYLSKMAHDNYIPDYDDFYQTMKARKFPFRYKFKLCKEEREKLSFEEGKNPGINGNTGYYLAHILDTGRMYSFGGDDFGTAYIEKNYFDCGKREDYVEENDKYGKCFVRDLGKINDLVHRKILVACFIRLTHPINNFICPNKSSCLDDLPNKNGIGESPELLAHAHNYFMEHFPLEYKQFLDLAMAPESYYTRFEENNNNIKIHCEIKCNTNKTSKAKALSSKVTSSVKNNATITKTRRLPVDVMAEYQDIISYIKSNYGISNNLRNKLGKLFVCVFNVANNLGKLTDDDIKTLISENSKLIFHTNFRVIEDVNNNPDPDRYLKSSRFTFNGHDYLITNDWYESKSVYESIVQWADSKGIKIK